MLRVAAAAAAATIGCGRSHVAARVAAVYVLLCALGKSQNSRRVSSLLQAPRDTPLLWLARVVKCLLLNALVELCCAVGLAPYSAYVNLALMTAWALFVGQALLWAAGTWTAMEGQLAAFVSVGAAVLLLKDDWKERQADIAELEAMAAEAERTLEGADLPQNLLHLRAVVDAFGGTCRAAAQEAQQAADAVADRQLRLQLLLD